MQKYQSSTKTFEDEFYSNLKQTFKFFTLTHYHTFKIISKVLLSRMKSISTSNHLFGRAIWDKLPECIFENFENYWLLVNYTKPNKQTLCIETNIF